MPRGEQLSRKQEQAIIALLGCKTVSAAAKKAGVAERTLRNWLALPVFQAAYAQSRQQVMERAVTRLVVTTDKAVTALARNLKCGEAGQEIRAAVAVLQHATRGVETLDLAQRIAELERLLSEHGTGRTRKPRLHSA